MEPVRISALGLLAVALLGPPILAQPVALLHCTASSLAGPVYSDGIAELVAGIDIDCVAESSAALSAGADIRLSVKVSLNTSVTNTVGFGPQEDLTDALLVVRGYDCPAPDRPGPATEPCGALASVPPESRFGRLTSPGTLEWSGVAIPQSSLGSVPDADDGLAEGPTIRIRGIRANASQLRLADSVGRAVLPVRAAISVRSNAAVTLQNAVLEVGYPVPALEVESVERLSESVSSGVRSTVLSVHVREGFSNALRGSLTKEAKGAGAASRVLLEFGGLPDGVAVSVPVAVGCTRPVTDDADRDSAGALVLGLVTGHEPDGSGGAASRGSVGSEPSVPIDTASGTGGALFEVQAQDPTILEECRVPVRFDVPSGQAGGVGTWVSASLAPRSSMVAATSDAPVPRFAAPSHMARRRIDLAGQSTTLLFPFVTNQAGFTSGLVITHGSREALVGRQDGSAGSCVLHYYGETSEENDFLLVQHTTQFKPGEQVVFTLSGGNAERNIRGIEEFQGYMMVVCGFPDARGYAFISDGFRGIADLAMGYVARVVSIRPNGQRVVSTKGPQ